MFVYWWICSECFCVFHVAPSKSCVRGRLGERRPSSSTELSCGLFWKGSSGIQGNGGALLAFMFVGFSGYDLLSYPACIFVQFRVFFLNLKFLAKVSRPSLSGMFCFSCLRIT